MPTSNTDRLRKRLLSEYNLNDPTVFPEAQSNYPEAMWNTGQFIKGLVDPIDQSTGMPNVDVAGPVVTGIKGARNISNILDKVIASKPTDLVDAAIAFAKAKYPTLTTLPDVLKKDSRRLFDVFSRQLGDFNPEENIARVFNLNLSKNLGEYLNTVMHEVMHSHQLKRQNRKLELLPPERGGTYVTPKVDFEKYLAQPVEVQARAAGFRGEKTLEKIRDVVEELPPNAKIFNFNQPMTKEVFQDVIQDAIMNKYKTARDNPMYPGQLKTIKGILNSALENAATAIARPESLLGRLPTRHFMYPPEVIPILKQRGYHGYINDDVTVPFDKLEDILGIPYKK